MTEKLECDRCNKDYTDEESITAAKDFQENWSTLCRRDGVEPRGIIACPNVPCSGELILREI